MAQKEIPIFLMTYDENTFMIENPDVTIEKRINEHTKAKLSAIVSQNQFDYFSLYIGTKTKVCFTYVAEDKEELLLFVGVITEVQTKTEGICSNVVYYLYLEALSYSYLMDIQYKNRSFQNIDMMYEELLNIVVKDEGYKGNFINSIGASVPLDCFTLQYRETDWEFLKRLASRFHMPLMVNDKETVPRIMFGFSFYGEVTEFQNYNYRAIRDIEKYRKIAQNYEPDYLETCTLFYEIFTENDKTAYEVVRLLFL